ncbi:MAG: hypothetical protein LBI29_01310, partial [Rickettsiales bacterium]|nr:hypothetical protein [Rickettsiales bacterium]
MFTPQARSKGYLGIASVSRGANSTNITFFDNRPSREIVRGKTASFGVSTLRSAGDFLGLFYSAFSGKPVTVNYSEPGVGDGVFYYDLPTSERVSLAMVAMGFVGAVAGFVLNTMRLDIPMVVTGLAGFIYSAYKLCTEAEQRIDIRSDGITRFRHFKSKLGEKGLEEGTILWPNGIGYEGLFENNRIKNNPNGKLILFPEEDRYTVEFSKTEISGKENERHTFTNAHYFNNISYNGVNKLLRFADGDVFRGIPYGNAEG